MNELTILTRQEPGIVELNNFDEIKAYLDARLDVYRSLIYSDDNLKTAKSDKATLTKLKKALDTRRKEIKDVCLEPYKEIEPQIKELIAMIDEPLAEIDDFVKSMEAKEKMQKQEAIHVWYLKNAAPLGELAEKVFDSPGFLDAKWLNKTCRAPEWQSAVREKIARATADISAIQSGAGAHTAAVLTKYLDGMDLEAAKAFKRDLEATAQVADATVTAAEDDDRIIGYKVLKLSGTQRQMEQILEYAKLLGLEIDELEDGMPQPMRELLTPDFDSFVAFDIETSGSFGAANGDKPAEITEIGASKVINGQSVEWKDWLCNPGRKIVPHIARLTHITDDMVANEPPVEKVIREFADFVGDLPLVGHNIKSSDLHYITRALKRAGVAMDNGFFDTYLYAKTLKERYGWENVKLEYLSKLFGIEQEEAHRAYCDAEANVGVYFKLKELQ